MNWGRRRSRRWFRKIEQALAGRPVLVSGQRAIQGRKGARLTTQIRWPAATCVYVPGGIVDGTSRKLPDVERKRLWADPLPLLPEDAGVIIRTASEGA